MRIDILVVVSIFIAVLITAVGLNYEDLSAFDRLDNKIQQHVESDELVRALQIERDLGSDERLLVIARDASDVAASNKGELAKLHQARSEHEYNNLIAATNAARPAFSSAYKAQQRALELILSRAENFSKMRAMLYAARLDPSQLNKNELLKLLAIVQSQRKELLALDLNQPKSHFKLLAHNEHALRFIEAIKAAIDNKPFSAKQMFRDASFIIDAHKILSQSLYASMLKDASIKSQNACTVIFGLIALVFALLAVSLILKSDAKKSSLSLPNA